jgi:hypothetical protein
MGFSCYALFDHDAGQIQEHLFGKSAIVQALNISF